MRSRKADSTPSTRRSVPSLGALAVAAAASAACSGSAPPPPRTLPHVSIELPPSARDYHEHDRGAVHRIVQVRFAIDPDDLVLLEERLPCKLGSVETAPPKYARVTMNDQTWYTPERARLHRGCDFQTARGNAASSFLVDLSVPGRTVVYAVLAYYWNPYR